MSLGQRRAFQRKLDILCCANAIITNAIYGLEEQKAGVHKESIESLQAQFDKNEEEFCKTMDDYTALDGKVIGICPRTLQLKRVKPERIVPLPPQAVRCEGTGVAPRQRFRPPPRYRVSQFLWIFYYGLPRRTYNFLKLNCIYHC